MSVGLFGPLVGLLGLVLAVLPLALAIYAVVLLGRIASGLARIEQRLSGRDDGP